MAVSARSAALEGLKAWRLRGTWPDQFVKKELPALGLSPKDKGLSVQLLYGTIQNLQRIDFYIGCYSSVKLRKIMPQVLDCLRLGVYQLVFLQKIPVSAAVNESVNLAKKAGGARAGGFANAILRKVASQRENLPEVTGEDAPSRMAVYYSHPLWFVRRMVSLLGEEETRQLLEADNMPPPVTARVNRLRLTGEELIARLAEEGVTARLHPWLPDCIVFETGGDLTSTRCFAEGLFTIQDAASQLPPWALDIRPGENVVDVCAAPGGKTLIAGQMQQGQGRLIAMDLHPFKCRQLEETGKRMGLSQLSVRSWDSTKAASDLLGQADKVICDVPCSGLGILRKKADIRFKKEEELSDLPQIQGKILEAAASYCRSGGKLVYSTCTILPEENQQVVEAFLKQNKEFSLCPLVLPGDMGAEEGYRTFYPHKDGTDGFFIACLRWNQES